MAVIVAVVDVKRDVLVMASAIVEPPLTVVMVVTICLVPVLTSADVYVVRCSVTEEAADPDSVTELPLEFVVVITSTPVECADVLLVMAESEADVASVEAVDA